MKRIAAAAAATLAISASAAMTGNDMLARFDSADQTDKAIITGYIHGTADVLGASGLLCFPKSATIGQAADIVAAWFRSNPDKRHGTGPAVVFVALGDVFPCAKKEKPTSGRVL